MGELVLDDGHNDVGGNQLAQYHAKANAYRANHHDFGDDQVKQVVAATTQNTQNRHVTPLFLHVGHHQGMHQQAHNAQGCQAIHAEQRLNRQKPLRRTIEG